MPVSTIAQIIIAETGRPPGPLGAAFGGYGPMMQEMLVRHGATAQTAVVPVIDGAPLPDPTDGAAMLITGSPAGVYEPHDWIAPLERAVRQWLDAGQPVVGICFGHQLMAQALGGQVEKAAAGWGVGVHVYDRADAVPPTSGLPAQLACAVSHQDQVVALPPGGRRLAGSAFCPNGVVSYGQGNGLSFQMHPEFSHEFAAALLEVREDRIPADIAATARQTFAGPSDRELMAVLITRFLHGEVSLWATR